MRKYAKYELDILLNARALDTLYLAQTQNQAEQFFTISKVKICLKFKSSKDVCESLNNGFDFKLDSI